ncbi:MAG: hypothetical protein Q7U33_06910 [Methylotenera sp.]|jgi:hypothetical protein|uniref:hypothetical protein n=1 Tax=Methylotenera sp. TaxID=2051956 RepID=UPI0027257266|nr:hypothetical protein [Methylotenera sp.]MDO9151090.1 hypothetical protein [Methylotenera sp.]
MNKKFVFILSYIVLFTSIPVHADFVEGSAGLGSADPHIPEPLLFDLVRPLGARKGELEVNTLAQRNVNGGTLEWAPEIEYAFADGLAIEFELPSENSKLTDYKIALQGTLSHHFNNPSLIQGWQVIVKKNRDLGKYSADALYINGYRFNSKWSTLNMLGVRKTAFGGDGKLMTLINNSVFYDLSPKLTYGIELNHEIDASGRWRYSYTPQIHADINRHFTIQAGLSFSRLNELKRNEETFALRAIYAF